MPIVPDAKSWMWVLERTCPECEYDAPSFDVRGIGDAIRANAATWAQLLAHPHVRRRPTDDQWSALEYGCHVRDVYRIFDARLARMLAEHDPQFQNWDQDETAIADRYEEQDPATVADELVAAASEAAARWDTVADDQWERPSRRSNGSRFTVGTFALYLMHDPVHHIADVLRGNRILAGDPPD